MLKRNVVVHSTIVMSADVQKRVADLVMVFIVVDRRVGGQKKQSKKKRKRASKSKSLGAYHKPPDELILLQLHQI